jgi:ribosomal RNA-processing protein 9
MAYIDTLFGHVQGCTQVDCLRKERVITVGEDRTCRLWKVQDETQLLFKGATGSGNIDACCFVNGTTFVTGSQDSSISLWSMFKKRPVYTYKDAHPSNAAEEGREKNIGDGKGDDSMTLYDSNPCRRWIHSLAACANTDLVASGSGNGKINLYKVDPDEKSAADRARPVCEIAGVEGYVNGLAFNNEATVLVAAVGQEPRMGRWDRNKQSKNALFVQKLSYEDI